MQVINIGDYIDEYLQELKEKKACELVKLSADGQAIEFFENGQCIYDLSFEEIKDKGLFGESGWLEHLEPKKWVTKMHIIKFVELCYKHVL